MKKAIGICPGKKKYCYRQLQRSYPARNTKSIHLGYFWIPGSGKLLYTGSTTTITVNYTNLVFF